ncbi:MAG: ribosomal-processing cysteine protease Prp [Solobacterium sp.]|nr:ribosomal-processing cysteine protease Prp [Solobacterium sp.]
MTEHSGRIQTLSVSGHAGSDEYGKDLVCAAVSAVVFGLANALDEMCSDAAVSINENLIDIRKVTDDNKTEIIMRTGYYQLMTIQEVNQAFVKVNITEV